MLVIEFIVREVWRLGEIKSLSRFCEELGMDYSHTYHCVKKAERKGLLRVSHVGHLLLLEKGPIFTLVQSLADMELLLRGVRR